MSKRMRELAEKAGYYIDPDFDIEFEVFAELIVLECMELASKEQKRYANITHRNMSECAVALSNFSLLIKDHFDYMVGETRVVCNPRGYAGHDPQADVFQLKFLDI